jgi:hypothetical protein
VFAALMRHSCAVRSESGACPAGRFATKPFASCPYLSVRELSGVSGKCRKTLIAACRTASLKAMPSTVQIVLFMCLAGLATKRASFAQEMVVELVQAADYVKTLSALPAAVIAFSFARGCSITLQCCTAWTGADVIADLTRHRSTVIPSMLRGRAWLS